MSDRHSAWARAAMQTQVRIQPTEIKQYFTRCKHLDKPSLGHDVKPSVPCDIVRTLKKTGRVHDTIRQNELGILSRLLENVSGLLRKEGQGHTCCTMAAKIDQIMAPKTAKEEAQRQSEGGGRHIKLANRIWRGIVVRQGLFASHRFPFESQFSPSQTIMGNFLHHKNVARFSRHVLFCEEASHERTITILTSSKPHKNALTAHPCIMLFYNVISSAFKLFCLKSLCKNPLQLKPALIKTTIHNIPFAKPFFWLKIVKPQHLELL